MNEHEQNYHENAPTSAILNMKKVKKSKNLTCLHDHYHGHVVQTAFDYVVIWTKQAEGHNDL